MGKSSKPKKVKIDTSGLVNNTPDAFSADYGMFGSTNSTWDPKTKTVRTGMTLSEPIQSGLNNAFSRIQNFDTRAAEAQQNAVNTYIKPFQTEMEAQIGDYFSGLGRSGRNNSRGVDAFARVSDELANKQASRLYELGNQARQSLMREDQQMYNAYMQPAQMTFNAAQGGGQAMANARQNLGQGLMNAEMTRAQLQAQQDAAAAQSNKSSKQQLLGAGLGFGASALGKFGGG